MIVNLICGIGCSGTSAVAGAVHKLGCPMHLEGHSNRHPDTGIGLYEDKCLYSALDRMTPDTLEHVRDVIRTHRQTPNYGFKNTLLGKALPWVTPLIQEAGDTPRIVVVHRTLVSSIEGRMAGRCTVPLGREYSRAEAELWAIRAERELLKGVQKVQRRGLPVYHLSFEHLLSDPEEYVGRLASFCFDRTIEDLSSAVEHIRPELPRR